MARPNVETVKLAYELAAQDWASGGEEVRPRRLAEVFDPGVVVQERTDFPDRDTYRGYEALGRWWAAFFEIYDEVRLDPQEFFVEDDRVVVRVRLFLRSKGGVALDEEAAHVFTVRDERIVHVSGYTDVAQALAIVRGAGS